MQQPVYSPSVLRNPDGVLRGDFVQDCRRRLPYGRHDFRRFDGRCLSALRKNPRHYDLLRHFRDGEELTQDFSSLDAQREACENYISSQKSKGEGCLPAHYDDAGYSGGNLNRPALTRLNEDIEAGKIDIVVTYKIDRLSRSLVNFAELQTFFEAHNTSFVSIPQEINTGTSSGRMMLNILMTFAQFEREVITERVRDKISASKKRGKFCGGSVVLGYERDPVTKKL